MDKIDVVAEWDKLNLRVSWLFMIVVHERIPGYLGLWSGYLVRVPSTTTLVCAISRNNCLYRFGRSKGAAMYYELSSFSVHHIQNHTLR